MAVPKEGRVVQVVQRCTSADTFTTWATMLIPENEWELPQVQNAENPTHMQQLREASQIEMAHAVS